MYTRQLLAVVLGWPAALIMTMLLQGNEVMASEITSVRVIYYSHETLEKSPLLDELNENIRALGNIEYIRKMNSGGHVLRLTSSDQKSLNSMMQTIKQLPLTRLLETDSIIKIQ
jgi:hypothetical protein